MKYFHQTYIKGFTLVELLTVVAIIALLSSVTFSSFTTARKKARISQRISHLKQVQNALEYYFAVNRVYPSTSGLMRSQCLIGGSVTLNNVIPGLTPVYLQVMPSDPQMDTINSTSCYISNGTDYAFLDYNVSELDISNSQPNYNAYPELVDPARDGGVNNNIVDGSTISAWKVNSSGGRAF
jgi:prepilin-type N-terminal cleavage/methylation domain-containing protein